MKQMLLFTLFLSFVFLTTSCYKEKFETSGEASLTFSRDTMVFDTVFTTQGSATRILKVYNDADLPVIISKISLEENDGVHFRFNFDGISGTSISDVEVPAKDSIYIFGEVTIDPDQPVTSSPFIVEGKLKFETNGNTQFVHLEAYGQNANYQTDGSYGGQYYYSCDMGEWNWDDPEGKPYVINGILFVDSCTINIPAGTNVYVHGGVYNSNDGSYNEGLLYLLPNAKLNITGTLENPVTFQTDRLEYEYDDVPGQWSGIRIGEGSRNNVIDNLILKNAIIGLRVDSSAQVSVYNSQFYHLSSVGIVGIHADIDLNTSLIYDTGSYGFQAIFGGNYNINYSTISTSGGQNGALSLSDLICYNSTCSENGIYPINTVIKNSIFYSSQNESLDFINASDDNATFNYSISNSIIKERELTDDPNFADFYSNCVGCINLENGHTLFVDVNENKLHLDTLSVAEQNAIPIIGFTQDLEGNMRDNSVPDIGCFEYVY